MASAILRPNRNVWRVERADRAAVLIDGAAFFDAVRQAFRNARHSIFVLGWDIDSRMRLVGETNRPDDGLPATLSEFLTELVRRRPALKVNLLLWDYSLLYANERELFPRLSLQWSTPPQIRLCLDNIVPFGCSQHQKIIVVDNALAFSGGLDLTIRRWDTTGHSADNPSRVDPTGEPFKPFHDVQMMVDGEAARALAEIACERWVTATSCEKLDTAPQGDPWPAGVRPDFTGIDIGIARTQPCYSGRAEVREAEALFFDSIDAASHSIYIENQFVTSEPIARRLAMRLRERNKLEVLIVAPHQHESWVETKTMRNGRIRFWRMLERAGGGRVRLMYPHVDDGEHVAQTMIHSKVMVIDDRFLRIGSANMNNRSMGADTECDLAIEAKNATERHTIVEIRNRLLGEHCGVTAAEAARALTRAGNSLVAAVDTLSANGHSLRPIDDGEPDEGEFAGYIEELADPNRPLRLANLSRSLGHHVVAAGGGAAWKIALAVVLIALLTLAWYVTPLAEWADPDGVHDWLRSADRQPWAGAVVIGTFLAGGLVAFPVTILIAATAAAFGPWYGFLYAVLGVLASALASYALGARFGQGALRRVLGRRLDRIRERIERQGVLAVAAIRVVPVAPFTFVNLAAGASAIKLVDYIVGTLLGMLPGLVVMSALGHRIVAILSDPSVGEVVLLAAAVIGWIGLSLAVQALVSRLWRRAS
jgi:phospholipase D1/2